MIKFNVVNEQGMLVASGQCAHKEFALQHKVYPDFHIIESEPLEVMTHYYDFADKVFYPVAPITYNLEISGLVVRITGAPPGTEVLFNETLYPVDAEEGIEVEFDAPGKFTLEVRNYPKYTHAIEEVSLG